jgi:light-regulated signal transduction histidine kinase (bacteriophytochrome)
VAPKHIDLEDRVQAGIFTALAANAYSLLNQNELNYRLELNERISQLKTKFLKHNNLFDSLIESKKEIKSLPEADGLAIVSDEISLQKEKLHSRLIRDCKWALKILVTEFM